MTLVDALFFTITGCLMIQAMYAGRQILQRRRRKRFFDECSQSQTWQSLSTMVRMVGCAILQYFVSDFSLFDISLKLFMG